MARRLRALAETEICTDAELVRAGSAGDDQALGELYRRHAPVAERVARSVAANPDDAADAVAEAFTRVFGALTSGRVGTLDFRSYLLAATRNAAIDQIRRSRRVGPSGDMAVLDQVEPRGGPSDLLTAGEDSSLIVQAFRDLPDRWQSVLWLTEVERVTPGEAAGRLGLSANNVSQLAVRARARLRERYLQALVRNHADPACQPTVDRLGAYVAGALTERRRAEVDAHLARCDDCRRRLAEVEDLGACLRRSALLGALLVPDLRRGPRAAPDGAGAGNPQPVPVPTSTATSTATSAATSPPPTPSALLASSTRTALARSGSGPAVQALATSPVALMAPVAGTSPLIRLVAAAATALLALVPSVGVNGSDEAAAVAAPALRPPVTASTTPPAPPATAPLETAPPETAPPAPPVATGPVLRPAATTNYPRSTVAQGVPTWVDVFASPGAPGPAMTLQNPTPSDAPLVFLVLAEQGEWLQVLLPIRPNGSTGWVARSDVSLTEHSYSIVVELGAHTITVFEGGRVILNELVGVGTNATPTPHGLHFTKELFRTTDASGNPSSRGPYGPFVFGLSGFSEVLFDFGGGDGVIGIHGTNDPSSLGRDVSHGCIRMSNEGITALAEILPLGVPVDVRP